MKTTDKANITIVSVMMVLPQTAFAAEGDQWLMGIPWVISLLLAVGAFFLWQKVKTQEAFTQVQVHNVCEVLDKVQAGNYQASCETGGTEGWMPMLQKLNQTLAQVSSEYQTAVAAQEAASLNVEELRQHQSELSQQLAVHDDQLQWFGAQLSILREDDTKRLEGSQVAPAWKPLVDGVNGLLGGVFEQQQTLVGRCDSMNSTLEDLRGKAEFIQDVVGIASHGDFSGDMMIFNGNEAIDHVANSIGKMLESLNTLIVDIQKSGIQVTSSATEIAATAKEQEATVTEQAATTSEIMNAAKEISSTSKMLVSTMSEVAEVAEETAKSASDSQSSLHQMETTMEEMVKATGSIGSKLSVINEKASNINTVVTTIAKVADQTNLLSLNAAIEAEKAGEYGAGFSVVATEIRRLADQTAVATWDIEQMVKEMQASVSSGVMGMETFTERVQRGVSHVREVSGQLEDIIEKVQALIPRFEYVREGMQSQSGDAGQISDSIEQLSEAAQQTAESLRYSNTAIAELNDAAQSLQDAVSRFKLHE